MRVTAPELLRPEPTKEAQTVLDDNDDYIPQSRDCKPAVKARLVRATTRERATLRAWWYLSCQVSSLVISINACDRCALTWIQTMTGNFWPYNGCCRGV